MACGCSQGKHSARPNPWVVKLPSGASKSYASEEAARATQARNPGSILIPPTVSA